MLRDKILKEWKDHIGDTDDPNELLEFEKQLVYSYMSGAISKEERREIEKYIKNLKLK